ncbi:MULTISPECIES: DUF4331 domain-containing protein [unclassified Nocardioides]|uniref:DUF4331 domain-containing protein n=1 Tax=unclassified Nocardioides TaxID=2615069 RepID=UPI0007023E35|nr:MULTISPECIES: DUF4331 domain-containing protein [unclassified Nocardioides]KQP64715.1 hypothetical protein ASF47_12435 [Nocardioides sp. Leaf285]KQQ43726.1 hypothetical protein ASF50_07475 [Nocardioides sp. Leaf307]MBJ7527969.1 DUF4331 domain-containing protein [Nocardioides sp.]
MSSHREAPEIAKDPAADGTDTYAFVSPENPNKVILIANFIPLQQPNGGPNFYEFADDVQYEIHVSNKGTSEPDITYQFRFRTQVRNPKTFLYNTGQITDISDEAWNRPQFYTVMKVQGGRKQVIGRNLPVPPVNVGPRSTPNYGDLADQATHRLGNGRKVFAGQRADAFHVDLGSIFDLGALRPFNEAHVISMPEMNGVNSVQSYNVHTIALQVNITELTRDGSKPDDVMDPKSVIGVWATASRRKSRMWNANQGKYTGMGPWQQVSRLGNPLFNEVIVPMAEKDNWNASPVTADKRFAKYVAKPELQGLLPALYPGVFPNLAAYDKPRADLDAILLTGIPEGVVPGFQNYTGPVKADMLRLNVAVPPTAPADENPIGLVAGDAAGFPNGRRLGDDVVAIELRAVAGATIPLVDPSYEPDAAAGALTDGTSNTNAPLLDRFPFLGLPGGGYQTEPGTTQAS